MTIKQLETIDHLEEMAEQEGARVECDEYDIGDDGSLVVTMTRSVDWDHERVIWTLDREGDLTIW